MAKIIILSRVSSAPQHIESQTKELVSEAERLGYPQENQIIIEDIESAIKLSEEERKGLNKMKRYIESDSDIDCVICWEVSRLARRQKVLYSITEYLVERKIQLYILNPRIKLLTDDRKSIDPNANIAFSLFATISENEMMIKKERFMRAKNELTKQGKKSAGSVKFGYTKNKDKFCVPDPVTSEIVADIFNHYITDENASLWQTYNYVSDKYPDIFPIVPYIRGQHKIRNILTTEIYAKGNWCYPSIITEETFEKAKVKMSNARCKPRFQSKLNLLGRGKVRCAHCGKIMTGVGGNVNAYYCPTDKEHSLQMNIGVLDWLIWRVVPTAASIHLLVNNQSTVLEGEEKIRQKENRLSQLKEKIDKSMEKEEKLVSLLLDNKITQEVYNSKFDELKRDTTDEKAEYERVKNQIIELKIINKNARELDIKDIKALYDITDFESRLEYVQKFLRDVVLENVGDKEIRIHFNWLGDLEIPSSDYLYCGRGGNPRIWELKPNGDKELIYNKRGKI